MAQKLNLPNLTIPPNVNRSSFPSTFTFGVATSAYQLHLESETGFGFVVVLLEMLILAKMKLLSKWCIIVLSFISKEAGMKVKKGQIYGTSSLILKVCSSFLASYHNERRLCIFTLFVPCYLGKVLDGSNGDVAVDHYHRYKEDVELIGTLGFSAYRFSISWSRIFPDGLGTEVNEEGVAFYNNLINSLLEKGIEPFVTLYHWDLPSHLQESIGGWTNRKIVDYFGLYADACFASFGDRVKHWITLNEPLQTSVNGHCIGIFAPGRKEKPLVEPYLVSHHQVLAHATAVSIYRSKYK
ncbi:hypothetical protein F2Q70_00027202, partial [Brassica cretica]